MTRPGTFAGKAGARHRRRLRARTRHRARVRADGARASWSPTAPPTRPTASVAEIAAAGGEASACVADVTDPDGVRRDGRGRASTRSARLDSR